MQRTLLKLSTGAFALIAVYGTAAAKEPHAAYTTFDPPGSVDTEVYAVNGKGVAAGYYYDGNRYSHGFVRNSDGSIDTFDPSGATFTYVSGINAKGAITGSWLDATGLYGFVRASDGTIKTFAARGAGITDPTGINDQGTITGYYE